MILKSNEPIKIELIQDNYSNYVGIYLDNICYAVINDITIGQLDLDKIKYWIEETYYDNSYKSSDYVPGYYSSKNFI